MPTNEKQNTARLRLIRLIHVARRELQMADEDYRAMLANMPALGGKISAANLSIKGLNLVLDALKNKGFKIKPKGQKKTPSRALADDAQSRKIRSLWLEMHDAGIVKDPSESALGNFICKQVKIEALQWLTQAQASAIIEHLKRWRDREINKKGAPKSVS